MLFRSVFSHSSNESQPQKQQVGHQRLLKKIEHNISWVWLFLEKKKEKKTFRLKKVCFLSSAIQGFTYHEVKLGEQEMCFVW